MQDRDTTGCLWTTSPTLGPLASSKTKSGSQSEVQQTSALCKGVCRVTTIDVIQKGKLLICLWTCRNNVTDIAAVGARHTPQFNCTDQEINHDKLLVMPLPATKTWHASETTGHECNLHQAQHTGAVNGTFLIQRWFLVTFRVHHWICCKFYCSEGMKLLSSSVLQEGM